MSYVSVLASLWLSWLGWHHHFVTRSLQTSENLSQLFQELSLQKISWKCQFEWRNLSLNFNTTINSIFHIIFQSQCKQNGICNWIKCKNTTVKTTYFSDASARPFDLSNSASVDCSLRYIYLTNHNKSLYVSVTWRSTTARRHITFCSKTFLMVTLKMISVNAVHALFEGLDPSCCKLRHFLVGWEV